MHGIDALRGESPNGKPFVRGPQHRQAQRDQVLENLAPADTAMNLDEIPAPVDLRPQRAPAIQLPENLPIYRVDRSKRVAASPQTGKRLFEINFAHARAAKITSAARSALL